MHLVDRNFDWDGRCTAQLALDPGDLGDIREFFAALTVRGPHSMAEEVTRIYEVGESLKQLFLEIEGKE